MKELKELVHVFKFKKVKSVEVFDEKILEKQDTLCYRLFQGIAEGKYKDDNTAARGIYSVDSSDNRYQKLKSRLKERLLYSIFFLDVNYNEESPYHQAFYQCHWNLFLTRGLFLNGARNNAVSILKKTLPIALKYQINDVVFCIANLLKKHYNFCGVTKEYDYYNNLAQNIFKTIGMENVSEEYFEEIRVGFMRSVSPKPELISTAKKYLKRLQGYSKNNDSFIMHFNLFRVWIFYLQMKGDYKKAIEVCKQAEMYVKNNPPFYQNVRLAEVALMMLECYLIMRDYENGNICAERCLDLFPASNINRLIFLEYYFLLAMHTGNYHQAKKLFFEAVEHPKFSSFSPERHEKWRIFESFLHYVLSTDTDIDDSAFNLTKFLNEIPIYSKDKRGYNVSILVVQILFLLRKDDLDAVLDKGDALKIYRSRYLQSNKPHNYRSNLFLKMLQSMIQCNFDYQKTVSITNQLLEKLKGNPNIYKGPLETMEVIPFEKLWEMVLSDLRKLSVPVPTEKQKRKSRVFVPQV